MTPERRQQIETIFHAVLELEASERPAFLAQACGDDLPLRQEVESLLAYSGETGGIMAAPLDEESLRLIAAGQSEALIGRMLAHYKVLERLGAGGMGVVLVAEDTKLGRKVALKLLPAASTQDAEQVRRLRKEARAASALNHQNIVTVYEVGQADARHFIAMECVQGETLRQQMRGGLLPREVIDIAAQVASALSAAHHKGIVHRDIKPENIMLSDGGPVKVLDFGIALLLEPEASGLALETETGAAGRAATRANRGTLSYMSPEQARGESLDERTDIFSLGIVLYEMVTGRRPFVDKPGAELLHALLHEEPPPLGEFLQQVPRLLEEIIGKALKKERDERYQTAGELLHDLKRLRRQLEARAAGEEAASHDGPWRVAQAAKPAKCAPAGGLSHAAALTSTVTSPRRRRSLSTFIRRYANWFLASGVLAALLAGADKLLLQPQGAWPAHDVELLMLAVGCLLVFSYDFIFARRAGARPLARTISQDEAFRGLLPFQENDREQFHGREDDTRELSKMVARAEFRFGVLYGDSGTGKTSLLTAGLTPQLRECGLCPFYCRSRDPLAALVEACRQHSRLEPRDEEPPVEYLRRVAEQDGANLVIIFDQFEEFFVNVKTKRDREPFVSLVAACHGASAPPVKFLFAIRSDFLHHIGAEFDRRIPEPLLGDKRYHLRRFDEKRAAEIIEKSARHAGLPLESDLCRQVASDLAAGDSVLPAELQIVGAQLQGKHIYTPEAYRRAGGREQLVHNFLEDVIRAAGDQLTARLLLRCLVSDENTRLTLTRKEIVRRVRRDAETVTDTLRLFVESQLVHEIQEEEPWRYELMHERLIEQINRVTGKVLDATQRADRLLRQYVSNYALDPRTRVPLTKLWSIHLYAKKGRGPEASQLLRRSLRGGLLRAGVLTLLLLGVTVTIAAMLSRSAEWEETVLRDGHTAATRRAVFSPDGRRLISVGEDKRIIVWDFARRERLRALTDHTDVVTGLAFSPDGKWFATGSNDQTVIVWDAARLEKVKVLREHRGPVAAVAFSPDGRLLASTSGGDDRRTILWEAGAWEKTGEVPFGLTYGTLLFSPNERQLMTATGEAWNLITGQQETEVECGNWAALSPDATRVVCISSKGEVLFWGLNPAGDLSRRKALDSYRVHRDNGRAVAFSPDGRFVATGGDDITLWDAAAQTRITRLKHTGIVWSLAFSPDNRWLVSTHGDGAVLVWDVAERESVADLSGHSAPVRAVAFSSNGRRIVSASEDRSVIVWDAESGQKEAVLSGHRTRVTAVAFSPDGNGVASADFDDSLIYWDVTQRAPQWTSRPESYFQNFCLAISPDGRWVATTNEVYETAGGRRVFDYRSDPEPREHISGVYGAAFSADGRRLVFVTEYGKMFLLDTASWQIVKKAEVSAKLISVSFSPDGKWLLTGEVEGAVRLWSVEPLREVATIGWHAARIKSVAFSPDGSTIASASDDKTIALWNVNRRSFITNVGTHAAPVLSVAFSPDGRQLVSGEHDNSVRLYTRHRTLWSYRY